MDAPTRLPPKDTAQRQGESGMPIFKYRPFEPIELLKEIEKYLEDTPS